MPPAFKRAACPIEMTSKEPPSERIAAYVTMLLERWRDITEDKEDTWPWSVGPLIDCASGPLAYFQMGWSMAEEASAYAAQVVALSSCRLAARLREQLNALVTDWTQVVDAHGAVGRVPLLLDQVEREEAPEAWDELWERLCLHGETVSAASFAALPRLATLAPACAQALELASAIVRGTLRHPNGEALLAGCPNEVARLRDLGVLSRDVGDTRAGCLKG